MKACPSCKTPMSESASFCLACGWSEELERLRAVLDAGKAAQSVPETPDNIFIRHIAAHLKPGQEVVCKICGKTAKEIINEIP